jgi:hypothetical protein
VGEQVTRDKIGKSLAGAVDYSDYFESNQTNDIDKEWLMIL